jgi:hypothetical protein
MPWFSSLSRHGDRTLRCPDPAQKALSRTNSEAAPFLGLQHEKLDHDSAELIGKVVDGEAADQPKRTI